MNNGFFGDLSGGLSNETSTERSTEQGLYDRTLIFNQRRFFVFFAYGVLSSNIVSSSISERALLSSMIYFIAIQ